MKVTNHGATSPPNVILILADDHAVNAVSAYGLALNHTPNIDRLANNGVRMDSAFCTNSICSPSRASILTGTYSHIHKVTSILSSFDHSTPTFPAALRESGYTTALFGKWHLGERAESLPRDFDAWRILRGQGVYENPSLIDRTGEQTVRGYVTDLITDQSIDWMASVPPDQPFFLMVNHKAPHRPWIPHPRHAHLYPLGTVPESPTLFDDYATRGEAAKAARMRLADNLRPTDVKSVLPETLRDEDHRAERTRWHYDRYLTDYLRTVQALDDGVGRILDYIESAGIADRTMIIYSSDQGYFLGDHGWYDKRFMYEESLQMPLLIQWPSVIPAGSVNSDIVTNVDFAATILDACGLPPAASLPTGQGRSFLPNLSLGTPDDWPRSMYYRYWEHDDDNHHVWAHYGVRTHTHKLIRFYNRGLGTDGSAPTQYAPYWELYDLTSDPHELTNVADDQAYVETRIELERELLRLQHLYGDAPDPGIDPEV